MNLRFAVRPGILCAVTAFLVAPSPANAPAPKPLSIYVLEVDTNIKGEFAVAAPALTLALESAFSRKSSTFQVLERRHLDQIVKANQLEKDLQNISHGAPASAQFAKQVLADGFIRGELADGPDGAVLTVTLTKLSSEILWQGRAKHSRAEWQLQKVQETEAENLAAEAAARVRPGERPLSIAAPSDGSSGALSTSSPTTAQPTISDKEGSTNIDAPVLLTLGEVVKGRLANSEESGKMHYWLVDLEPGSYKAVIDIRRADLDDGNVGGRLDWFTVDGQKLDQLGFISELPNERYRGVFRFGAKKRVKAVIRYFNFFTVSDYWLGLFKADAPIAGPFFSKNPVVNPLQLGQPITTNLEGTSAGGGPVNTVRDGYYSLRLATGDYKVSTEYRRADGQRGNVGGTLWLLDSDGAVKLRFHMANKIEFFDREIGTLSLAEPATAIFKVRAFFGPEIITLKVESTEAAKSSEDLGIAPNRSEERPSAQQTDHRPQGQANANTNAPTFTSAEARGFLFSIEPCERFGDILSCSGSVKNKMNRRSLDLNAQTDGVSSVVDNRGTQYRLAPPGQNTVVFGASGRRQDLETDLPVRFTVKLQNFASGATSANLLLACWTSDPYGFFNVTLRNVPINSK